MRDTIKQHKDFACADTDPTFKCPLFIVRAKVAKIAGDARYGIHATKRTWKRAVDRNRAKRLLRVWIRANEAKLNPELDYIFIARRDILGADLPTGVAMVKTAAKKLKLSC